MDDDSISTNDNNETDDEMIFADISSVELGEETADSNDSDNSDEEVVNNIKNINTNTDILMNVEESSPYTPIEYTDTDDGYEADPGEEIEFTDDADETIEEELPNKIKRINVVSTETISEVNEDIIEYYDSLNANVYAVFKDGTRKQVEWSDVFNPADGFSTLAVTQGAVVASRNNQNFWTDTNGAHVTDDSKDDWDAEYALTNHGTLNSPTAQKPWHNILLNSQGILLRQGLFNLSQMTKGMFAFYDGNGNTVDNLLAYFGASEVQIGKSSEKHVVINTSGVTAYNGDGSIASMTAYLNGSYIEDSTITNSKIVNGTITGTKISDSTITGSKMVDGTITGTKIDNATITGSKMVDGSITGTKIAGSTIENSNIKDGTITGAKIQGSTLTDIPYAEIDQLKSRNISADSIQSATGFIVSLGAENISASNIIADHATISALDNNYAQITMANVNNAWIENGAIKDASIGDAQIIGVSADKLTAGTIDASRIRVTNLNAKNINVEKINGQTVTGKSVADALAAAEAEIDTAQSNISSLDSKIDSAVESLDARIDAQIETFTTDAVPTLSNHPASNWDTDELKSEHVGDICYVMNSAGDEDGYTYRFAYDTTSQEYGWVLIKDNQVTAALARLLTAEGKISGLETFESETTSWIEETDNGLTTIRTNHTELSAVVDKTIKTSIQLWFTKANTTAPNKPTTKITSTSTAGNAWRIVVPAWNASYPNYFYCWQYEYADDTFGWSAVVHDIAMGESQSTSHTAQTTANANIKSSVMLWFSKADTTAPDKPTTQVTSTSTAGNAWRIVVPAWNASYPYYFYCYQQQKGDGTYQWTDVVYDQATSEAQSTARAASSSIANYITSNDAAVQSLQGQIDKAVDIWYGATDPSSSVVPESGWSSDDKSVHVGDLYYNTTNGHSFRYVVDGSTYSWAQLPESDAAAALSAAQDAQATADGKRRVFTSQPTVPYDIGDLWVNGEEVKYAIKKRTTGNYTASEWAQTATDDTAANAAQTTANANIKSSVMLWFTKANSTAPDKPTARVTTNDANSGNAWNLVVPTYSSSYPYYFYCYQQQKGDGTYQWTDVVYDQATSESQQKAQAALPAATFTNFESTTFKSLVDEVDEQSSTITSLSTRIETSVNMLLDTDVPSITKVFAPSPRYWSDNTTNNNLIVCSIVEIVDPPAPGIHYAAQFICPGTATVTTQRALTFYSAQNTTDVPLVPGQKYTVSWWARCLEGSAITAVNYRYKNTNSRNTGFETIGGSDWEWHCKTIEIESLPTDYNRIWFYARFNASTAGTVQLCGFRLVPGIGDDKLEETTNTVNTISQTADGNRAKITSLESITTANGLTSSTDITQRVSDAEQTLSEFRLSVAETYSTKNESYQNATPNITPWFSAGVEAKNSNGYWNSVLTQDYKNGSINTSTEGTKSVTALSDGWAHIVLDARSTAGNQNKNAYINTWVTLDMLGDIKKGATYTWLAEIRNLEWIGASDSNFLAVYPSIGNATLDKLSSAAVASMRTTVDAEMRTTVVAKSDFSSVTRDTRGYMMTQAECCAEFDIRVSLYEGDYTGPYKPYIGSTLYPSQMDVSALSSRVTTAEFNITANADNIALKVNATDVYTKTQTDGLISTEVSNRNTAIEQSASEIQLSVSETYSTKNESYQNAKPNLIPLFSSLPITPSENSYWVARDGSKNSFATFEDMGDGWVHVYFDNTANTAISRCNITCAACPAVQPAESYTFLFEYRNNQSIAGTSGSNQTYIMQKDGTTSVQFWGNSADENLQGGGPYVNCTVILDSISSYCELCSDGVWRKRIIRTSETADSQYYDRDGARACFTFTIYAAAEGIIDAEMRVSIYEGRYTGPYKPYSGMQLYASQAGLKITNDEISTKVSKDGVISSINQSAETVKIQASKVEIDGAAVFNSISSSVDNAITSKGYATTTQVASAKSEAISAANDATDTKLTSYSTTTEVGNAILNAVNDIEIGGRNLLKATEELDGEKWGRNEITSIEGSQSDAHGGTNAFLITPNSSAWYLVSNASHEQILLTDVGTTYTFSIWLRADNPTQCGLRFRYLTASGVPYSGSASRQTVDVTTEWRRFVLTGTLNTAQTTDSVWIGQVTTEPIYVYHPKLERGSKPTDWSPAPEDITQSAVNIARADTEDLIAAIPGRVFFATCTTAAATKDKEAIITPETPSFELFAGVTVNVKFTYANSYSVTADSPITLNVNGSGAKTIISAGATVATGTNTTIYGRAGYTNTYVYDGTYWTWVGSSADNNTTYNLGQNLYNSAIKAQVAITAAHLIWGNSSGYKMLAALTEYDLGYPILYAGSAIAINKTGTNNFTSYPGIKYTTTGTITNAVANKTVWLKGTIVGNTFKTDSSPFLTCDQPSNTDGFFYIPLGIMTSETNGHFFTSKELYAYMDGSFRQVTPTEIVATQTIYKQAVSGTNSMDSTLSWVINTGESVTSDVSGLTPVWTTKHPTYRSNYPVIFVATQTKRLDTTIICTTPVKDDTTTIIDGGHITTGTIDATKVAVTNLDASKITTGYLNADRIEAGSLTIAKTNGLQTELDDAEKTATSYITDINSNTGIVIHSASDQSNRITLNSDGMSIYKDNKCVANYGDTIVLGQSARNRITIDYNSMAFTDRWAKTYFYIEDHRNEDGYFTERFISDGETTIYYSRYRILPSRCRVEVSDSSGGDVQINTDRIIFNTPPTIDSVITLSYETPDNILKSYTLGIRKSGDIGDMSFVEGYNNLASGDYSHAGGYDTTASGNYSYASGEDTTASGNYSYASGEDTTASGNYSYANGSNTTASGNYSYANGSNTTASGNYSYANGLSNTADGVGSHVEGLYTSVTYSGEGSHAEGIRCIVNASYSHIEGYENIINKKDSYSVAIHVEGAYNTANAQTSHVEGSHNTVTGENSHVEGSYNTVSGISTHVEGSSNTVSGSYSHVSGVGNISATDYQTVIGTYNTEDVKNSTNTRNIFVVGSGSSSSNRSDALEVQQNGRLKIYDSIIDRDGADPATENVYSTASYDILDRSGETITELRARHSTTGEISAQLIAYNEPENGGSQVHNALSIGVDGNGTRYYSISDSRAFRDALGASSGIFPRSVGGTGQNGSVSVNISRSNIDASAGGFTCYYNGVCCTVQANSIKVSAALASNGSIQIGTLPSGCPRPHAALIMPAAAGTIVFSGKLMVHINTSGVVTLYNRSDTSLPTSTTIHFVITYAT